MCMSTIWEPLGVPVVGGGSEQHLGSLLFFLPSTSFPNVRTASHPPFRGWEIVYWHWVGPARDEGIENLRQPGSCVWVLAHSPSILFPSSPLLGLLKHKVSQSLKSHFCSFSQVVLGLQPGENL